MDTCFLLLLLLSCFGPFVLKPARTQIKLRIVTQMVNTELNHLVHDSVKCLVPAFQYRFQHLLQRHAGQAGCIEIHRTSAEKEARLSFQQRCQHLLQRHFGEAETKEIHRKSFGKEARPAFQHRFQHLLQRHSGEAAYMEMHRNSIGRKRGRLFNIDSNIYRRGTLERQNVWKYKRSP